MQIHIVTDADRPPLLVQLLESAGASVSFGPDIPPQADYVLYSKKRLSTVISKDDELWLRDRIEKAEAELKSCGLRS